MSSKSVISDQSAVISDRRLAPPVQSVGFQKVLTCPNCLEEYTLGRTGTVKGCDRCEGITRNKDGMIIPDPFVEVFIEKVQS